MIQQQILFFRKKLQQWAAKNDRPMPWKGEKNPYLIWLSEVILQQTRVEQGMPYFLRFKEKYPTVQSLAAAPLDEVLLLWEGLGYYSRARNLHQTAKIVTADYGGVFPDTYEELLSLKGVGEYTAAAIASFAFDIGRAVVDGNVIRVLSRYCGIKTAFDTAQGKKIFKEFAAAFLDTASPAAYNQAIMDFGATVCVPKNPLCEVCPLHSHCVAYQQNRVEQLPQRSKKNAIRERHFVFYIIMNKKKYAIEKRTAKDIWQDLYQFPMWEAEPETVADFFKKNKLTPITKSQLLSHQRITGHFVFVTEKNAAPVRTAKANWIWITQEQFADYAFPKLINLFVKENNVY